MGWQLGLIGWSRHLIASACLVLWGCATHPASAVSSGASLAARPLPAECLRHTPESVAQRNSNRFIVDPVRSWDSSIFFASDSDAIEYGERQHLLAFFRRLHVDEPDVFSLGTIIVAGYADPSERFPRARSESRAKGVGRLIMALGIAPERLVVLDEGLSKRPVVDQDQHTHAMRVDVAVIGACLFDFPIRSQK